MRIAILHPSFEGSNSPLKGVDPQRDPSRYLPGVDCSHIQIVKATAVRQVMEVAQQGFDVAINLCDGAWDEDRPGFEVVQALERLNVAFTGAGSSFYDPTREAMKMAATSVGVSVPAYVKARSMADADRAIDRLRFPMIVKHPHGYSSVGMTKDSRVTEPAGLRSEVARFIQTFGGALIEEFIEGREFTVLVTEPREGETSPWALKPVEFLFPPGESFKHFDLKWVNYEGMQTRLVRDASLSERLQMASALTFEALGGSGYGRCDLRMDESGEIFLLEINPNCSVFYPEGAFGSADFILASDPAGHRGFLLHLLSCAKRRQQRGLVPWEVHYDRRSGFGMAAIRKIAEGEIVIRYEESAHTMASKQHVERRWTGLKREWFDRYAWPASDNVFHMWSQNPEDWRPINHSCDPNTWLEGLDLVARKSIPVGEPLTVDYATFCGPTMTPFECSCGATECRQIIRGTDFMLPDVRARYGDHVSDFIRMKTTAISASNTRPFEVVKNAVGSGLVARRAWKCGEAIINLEWGPRQSEPSRWTVQCGHGEHAEPWPFELRYVNHSCDPNVYFDVDQHVLVAVRDINPGDEFRYFYPSTECSMAEPFECQCGAERCLGQIAGASGFPQEILDRYRLTSVVQHWLRQLNRNREVRGTSRSVPE